MFIIVRESALLGGSGVCPPRKILDFRPSEIVSGAVLGQNSSTIDDPPPLKQPSQARAPCIVVV